MTTQPDYVSGTITLTNGSADFTGTGAGWLAAGIGSGDMIIDLPGTAFQGVIATTTGPNSGTLTKTWDGPTLTNIAYRIRWQPDGSRYPAKVVQLIELLGNGNLQAEAGLTGAADRISYYTGAATKALATFTAKARAILSKTTNADVLTEIGAQPAGNYVVDSMPTARMKGRVTAGTGPLEDLTQSQVRTFLNISALGATLDGVADITAAFTALGWAGSTNTTPTGWIKSPQGLLIQYARAFATLNSSGQASVNFPTVFQSHAVSPPVVVSINGYSPSAFGATFTPLDGNIYNTGFSFGVNPNPGAVSVNISYIAVGRAP